MTRIEPAGFGKNRRTGGFHLTRAVRRRRGDPAASSQQLQPEFVRHSPPRRSSCLLVAYCLQVVSRESPPPVSLFSALLVPPSLQGPAVQPSSFCGYECSCQHVLWDHSGRLEVLDPSSSS
ncbi:uncharacterized protein DS421_15g510840 [Arachis hypogaea]|nr:uncharacterized protein DS421_15g510840 [Arachis hypogaea]